MFSKHAKFVPKSGDFLKLREQIPTDYGIQLACVRLAPPDSMNLTKALAVLSLAFVGVVAVGSVLNDPAYRMAADAGIAVVPAASGVHMLRQKISR